MDLLQLIINTPFEIQVVHNSYVPPKKYRIVMHRSSSKYMHCKYLYSSFVRTHNSAPAFRSQYFLRKGEVTKNKGKKWERRTKKSNVPCHYSVIKRVNEKEEKSLQKDGGFVRIQVVKKLLRDEYGSMLKYHVSSLQRCIYSPAISRTNIHSTVSFVLLWRLLQITFAEVAFFIFI